MHLLLSHPSYHPGSAPAPPPRGRPERAPCRERAVRREHAPRREPAVRRERALLRPLPPSPTRYNVSFQTRYNAIDRRPRRAHDQEWRIEGPEVLDIGDENERVGKLEVGIVGGRVDVVTHDDSPTARLEVHPRRGDCR